jgi:hypothetical protein
MRLTSKTFVRGVIGAVVACTAGLSLASGTAWSFHDDDLPLVQPSYGDIKNLRILDYTDLGFGDAPDGSALDPVTGLPWDRSSEFRVRNGYAYVANYQGWSIVDVRNPRDMKVVFRQQNERIEGDVFQSTQYIDIRGNILVVKETNRLSMWDVSNKEAPVRLSTFAPPDIGSRGYHGLWVHQDGNRRFAFAVAHINGYTGDILLIVDITDPRNPREVSRWWYPGQGPGETPDWPLDAGLTVQAHDLTTYGDRAYVAWRDKGLIILDISNISRPTRVGEINWSTPGPGRPAVLPGQTHSFGIVIPEDGGPVETLVSTDEIGQCPYGYPHFLDIRDETRPREISVFQLPLNLHGNCPPDRPGRRFGVHDVERMIRGDIVWSAWEEAGFWGIDISDIHNPTAAAYFVPPVRSDSPARSMSGHADDVFVTRNGTIFGSSSDPGAGGLWAMRYRPGFEGTVRWNTEEDDVLVRRTENGG